MQGSSPVIVVRLPPEVVALHRSAALLLLPLALLGLLSGPVPARAAEVGPGHLGLPAYGGTLAVPESNSEPLRLGLYTRWGTLDPEHGIDVQFPTREVSSRELRFQVGVRPSQWSVVAGSLLYRRVAGEGEDTLSGWGDLEVAGSTRFYTRGSLRIGGWAQVRLPVGDESKGLSTGQVEGEYGLTTAVTLFEESFAPRMDWTWNVGYRINKNESFGYGSAGDTLADTGAFFPVYPAVEQGGSTRDNDQLLLRSSLAFRQRWGHIFLDWSAAFFAFDDRIPALEGESWITPGVYIGGESGPALKASWSIGLHSDDTDTDYLPRLPDWFAEVGVSMPIFLGGRDRDGDRIPDSEDGCPLEPEDLDGYRDDDGCPDEDNDGDGIPDRLDLAPNLAEDFDGFEDTDGRPDRDNDLDGIADTEDACPMQPEDFDGDQDQDGCPDVFVDADGDGLEDDEDDCPFQAEDLDGFEDDDGCPEPDNDLDGIADVDDDCPMEAEDYDGVEDEDGCPDDPPPAQESSSEASSDDASSRS